MSDEKKNTPFYFRVDEKLKAEIEGLLKRYKYKSQRALLIDSIRCLQGVLEGKPLPSWVVECKRPNGHASDTED